ncbi:LuxR C-terminal-related transcriptional regulator [Occultella kanbiaonis]|uniref:LuxR C-terminal-related transcriptional regulator n=1 Tax=Occultella kanbiaonis TaxID=2675754 RepID=UPI0013CFC981|nr:LuxR C-terminal-related transcriptional regulator [Occultella kanbiaonis]
MPLLGTKLHVPSPRRELVARSRLTDRLRTPDGAAPRLVLVAAPAGFGKTTLLSQWLAGAAAGDDQLSDRELEVLRLLATDLTGPEIARRLFVSVNTLRTHTKHIFTKLAVNTRRAAVRRADELGLTQR